MAGPGKPGPPAWGHEQVEYHHLKVRVIELLDQGLRKSEIADAVGYKDRGQAYRLIDRVMRENLVEAGTERLRRVQFNRCERLWAAIAPYVTGDDGLPLDEKKVNVAIRVLEREARLMGIDGPTGVNDEGRDDRAGSQRQATDTLVGELTEFNTLAAELRAADIGNGMTDAEQRELLTASPNHNGAGSDQGADDGADDDDEWSDDEVDAEILDIAMDWCACEDQKHSQAG